MISVLVLLEKENKVLLYRRQNTGWGDGYFSAPSGTVEEGESPLETAKRELIEEIGVIIRQEDLKLVHIEYSKRGITMMFSLSKWDGDVKILEPDKMTDLAFYDIADLPTPIVGNGEMILDMIRKNILYSERFD